jgi:hypothetical protein
MNSGCHLTDQNEVGVPFVAGVGEPARRRGLLVPNVPEPVLVLSPFGVPCVPCVPCVPTVPTVPNVPNVPGVPRAKDGLGDGRGRTNGQQGPRFAAQGRSATCIYSAAGRDADASSGQSRPCKNGGEKGGRRWLSNRKIRPNTIISQVKSTGYANQPPEPLFLRDARGTPNKRHTIQKNTKRQQVQPLPPFVIKEGNLDLKVHVGSEGQGGERYCFRYCLIILLPIGRGRDVNGYWSTWRSTPEGPMEPFGQCLLQKKSREQAHTAK